MFWDHWLVIVAPKPIILYPLNWVIDFKMDRFHKSFVMKMCDLFGKSHQTQWFDLTFWCILSFILVIIQQRSYFKFQFRTPLCPFVLTLHRTSLTVFVFLELARIAASSSHSEVLFGRCFVCFKCILPFILSQAPKKAKRRQQQGEGGSSNVFSMFEQSQIQEYKEVKFSSSHVTFFSLLAV